MKKQLLDFYHTVLARKSETKKGFKRLVIHNNSEYELRADFREYGYINWSIWHDNQQLGWTDRPKNITDLAKLVEEQ